MQNNGGHFDHLISVTLMKIYAVDAIYSNVIFVPCPNTIT